MCFAPLDGGAVSAQPGHDEDARQMSVYGVEEFSQQRVSMPYPPFLRNSHSDEERVRVSFRRVRV